MTAISLVGHATLDKRVSVSHKHTQAHTWIIYLLDVASQVLGGHDIVCSTISLACDDGELGDSSLAVGIQKLGTMSNDTTVFLTSTRQEARNVNKRQQWDVECITEANEASSLHRGVNVEDTRGDKRLVSNHTDSLAIETRETNNYVLGVGRSQFKEAVFVRNLKGGT